MLILGVPSDNGLPSDTVAVTTSHHQTTYAPAEKKRANSQNGNVKIRQYRLMRQPQEKRRNHYHRNFVMVVNDPLLTSDYFGGHHKTEEHNHRRYREPRHD